MLCRCHHGHTTTTTTTITSSSSTFSATNHLPSSLLHLLSIDQRRFYCRHGGAHGSPALESTVMTDFRRVLMPRQRMALIGVVTFVVVVVVIDSIDIGFIVVTISTEFSE